MLDPVSIFMACKAAHSTISQAVSLYKDLKADGKDLSNIMGDITGALSKFFTHKDSLAVAEIEAKKNPSKKTTIEEESMNRVMRTRELQQMETDLREMVIYQMDAGGLWKDFSLMREAVRKERLLEENQKKRIKRSSIGSVSSRLNGSKFGSLSQPPS